MLVNLKTELDRNMISIKSLSEFLGISEKTVRNKISEKTDFTYKEAVKIQKMLLPQYSSDYLFRSE